MKAPKKQVIHVNGIYVELHQAIDVVAGIMCDTQTLVDHPDQHEMESAKMMLNKLYGKDILSAKVETIVAFNRAYIDIQQFTEDEMEKTYE